MGKRRIIILGGGMGGLATAFWLTDRGGWQERFDVTVYTLGFRLGGKGATGFRAGRVLEHGIHSFYGFYSNCFRMLRGAYRELGRDWQAAFVPERSIVYMEEVGGDYRPWPVQVPALAGLPGDEPRPRPLVVRWVEAMWRRHDRHATAGMPPPETQLSGRLDPPESPTQVAGSDHPSLLAETLDLLQPSDAFRVRRGLDGIRQRIRQMRAGIDASLSRYLESHDGWRRRLFLLRFAATLARGVVRDRVLTRGFAQLDNQDFFGWLARHSVHPSVADPARNTIIRGLYEAMGAYRHGDPKQPWMAAGVMLRILIVSAASSHGAWVWAFAHGIGDDVFAPLFEVLSRRGVRFEFFHRVDSLEPTADGRDVERVRLGRQATVRQPPYRPLISVDGVQRWPEEPRLDQLREGPALADGVDLENHWTSWRDVATVDLQRGRDFDVAVLALSVGTLATTTAPLMAACERWRAMVDGQTSVAFQSAQIYGTRTGQEMGATWPPALIGAYRSPFGSWFDQSRMLPPPSSPTDPRALVYMTGPIHETSRPPPATDLEYPRRANAAVLGRLTEYVASGWGGVYPKTVTACGEFDWSLLEAPAHVSGPARMSGQFWVARIQPQDRLAQTFPGNPRSRLAADASGFDNLFLAAEWVATGLNFKSFEATAMAAMRAARAINGDGHPQDIALED